MGGNILSTKIFDEYYCTNDKERDYLKSKGFYYTYYKRIVDTKPTDIWKYKKCPELYLAVAEFYKEMMS
jgi:hypothetical protein